nr:hypothetical protein [Tanacetum cinerariifolium]
MSIQEIEDLKQQYLDEMKRLINSEYRDEIKSDELKGNFNSMSIEINKKKKLQQLEQVANLSTYHSKQYEVFYDDHVKEISSGSTTTHSDSSLYDSFIFDLSINPFPHADRSDFHEFADELIHIISPPEYDCFFFKIEPNSRDFTMDVVEDISPTRKPRVHNALPTHPTLQLNLEFKLSSESLFTYVVWIFLPFLLYSVAP